MPASRRVSPSERFRAEVDEAFSSGSELGQGLEEVARLGVRLLVQVALKAEISEFLGRERYHTAGDRCFDVRGLPVTLRFDENGFHVQGPPLIPGPRSARYPRVSSS